MAGAAAAEATAVGCPGFIIEGARAAVLSLHSAAGLTAGGPHKVSERMLRAAEGLARAAVAQLLASRVGLRAPPQQQQHPRFAAGGALSSGAGAGKPGDGKRRRRAAARARRRALKQADKDNVKEAEEKKGEKYNAGAKFMPVDSVSEASVRAPAAGGSSGGAASLREHGKSPLVPREVSELSVDEVEKELKDILSQEAPPGAVVEVRLQQLVRAHEEMLMHDYEEQGEEDQG